MAEARQWAGTTYGNSWMHRWLISILRVVDVRVLYVFSAVFIVPVCLLLRPSFGIIYRVFRERFGDSVLQSLWKTYLNHCMFSQVVIDRFAMYAGKRFSVDIEGEEYFQSLASKPEGFVQLSAHVGNYEIAGYSLAMESKPLNALVFGNEKSSVIKNRDKMFAGTHVRMIPVSDDMSHLFLIDGALQRGEIVSMPADRILGSQKTLRHIFLCRWALFPEGPFRVAAMRGLDVIAVNVMKTSAKKYKIYAKPLHYDKQASRKEQISQLSQEYVYELERMVIKYPTQWYNYFEFWI